MVGRNPSARAMRPHAWRITPKAAPKLITVRRRPCTNSRPVSGGLNPWRKRACGWSPQPLLRTVTPKRPPNAELRRREHLTEAEVERLMEAAKGNRWGLRDPTMVLVAYRHGLRASELARIRWTSERRPCPSAGSRRARLARPRRRAARPAAAAARAGAEVNLRIHLGAGSAVHHSGVCPHGRARRLRSEAGL